MKSLYLSLAVRLTIAIAGSVTFEVDGPHDSIVTRSEAYLPVLLDAIASVKTRVSSS